MRIPFPRKLVDPTTELTSAEANVLPHIQSVTADLSGREGFEEPIDDVAPTRSVERSGTDIDLRVRRVRRRRLTGAVAPVVVRMQVEHDERTAVREGVQPSTKLKVELVIEMPGTFDLLGGRRLAPQFEVPRVFGRSVHGVIPRAVEIDFEARAVRHDRRPADRRQVVGEGILFS